MTDMRPVVFLDIDGPMIPSSMFFVDPHASFDRKFSPICVAILKTILEECDACVVTNSTHNRQSTLIDNNRSIREALIGAGVPAERFHADPQTVYPDKNRLAAIMVWLAQHGERPWIALDDANFMSKDHPQRDRLILVNPSTGLTGDHYNEACYRLLGNDSKARYYLM